MSVFETAASRAALIDGRAEKYASRLESFGYEVIALPPDHRLSPPVASHPDLLFFRMGDSLIARREYLEDYPELAKRIEAAGDCRLIFSDAHASAQYPDDCGLCAISTGERLLCRPASILPEIKSLCLRLGIEIAEVSQGYTACSCLVPARGCVITSDAGIARVAREKGLRLLLIPPGDIALPPYEYGFIGGCAGVDGECVYFYGDPLTHPSGKEICNFIEDCGGRVISLGGGQLQDFGKILFI